MIPLPDPTRYGHYAADGTWYELDLYTSDQLRAYAEAVRADERERCARICGDEDVAPTDDPCGVQKCIAAAIRKGE